MKAYSSDEYRLFSMAKRKARKKIVGMLPSCWDYKIQTSTRYFFNNLKKTAHIHWILKFNFQYETDSKWTYGNVTWYPCSTDFSIDDHLLEISTRSNDLSKINEDFDQIKKCAELLTELLDPENYR